jgi:hypothetical protein
MNNHASIIGYGVILENEETKRLGIAGLTCQVLSNPAPDRSSLRVYVSRRGPDEKNWIGPRYIKTEYVQLTH